MLARLSAAVLPCLAFASPAPPAPTPHTDPEPRAQEHYVSVGREFSFFVDLEGKVKGTGRNAYGQLGTSSQRDAYYEPRKTVPSFAEVTEMAAGAFHSLALDKNGVVHAVGRNNHGQLGEGDFNNRRSWQQVPNLEGVQSIAAGYAHSVFLMQDGTVRTAGLNSAGQLGNGNTEKSNTHELAFNQFHDKATGIAAGYDFTYIMTEKGALYAFGQNLGGQLGLATTAMEMRPVLVANHVKMIAAGESHGVYVDTHDKLFATGANFDGQFGDDGNMMGATRWAFTTNDHVGKVSAGGDSTCIAQNDQLKCMGSNRFGQLGLGEEPTYLQPTVVKEVTLTESIALSETHGFFIDHDDVYVTGLNSFGQLGFGIGNKSFNTPQFLVNIPGRGTRPPTPAPVPTPAPLTTTPAPTPAPTPEPTNGTTEVPREVLGNDIEGMEWWVLILLGAGSMVVVFVFVRLGNVGDKPDAGVAGPEGGEAQEVPATTEAGEKSQFV